MNAISKLLSDLNKLIILLKSILLAKLVKSKYGLGRFLINSKGLIRSYKNKQIYV